jgi:hypothetical protein
MMSDTPGIRHAVANRSVCCFVPRPAAADGARFLDCVEA